MWPEQDIQGLAVPQLETRFKYVYKTISSPAMNLSQSVPHFRGHLKSMFVVKGGRGSMKKGTKTNGEGDQTHMYVRLSGGCQNLFQSIRSQ